MGFVFSDTRTVDDYGYHFSAEWRRDGCYHVGYTEIPRAMDEITHFDVEAEDHVELKLMIGGNTIDVWRGSGTWAPVQGGMIASVFLQEIIMTVKGGPAVIRMHCIMRRHSDRRSYTGDSTIHVTRGNRSVVLCLHGIIRVTPVPQDTPWSIATHATKFGEYAPAVTGVADAAAAVVPVEIAVPLLSRCFATDELAKVIAQQCTPIQTFNS